MAHKSLTDLLKPLQDATEAGRLKWRMEGGSRFCATLPSYEICVWEHEDDAGFDLVSAVLLNRRGDVLDELRFDEFMVGYDRLLHFLKVARRSAINFDAVADDVISQLKELTP